MRKNPHFEIVQIDNDPMAIPIEAEAVTYHGIVALNETSAFLLQNMENDISEDELLALLLQTYDVDADTAKTELAEILNTFRELGLVE